MNINEKTEQMKKFILSNNIFIALQIILVTLSVIFNFIANDGKVFLTVFIHIGVFVIYNGIAESIIEYSWLRKKYAKICDQTHYLRYFKLKNRMYKTAKNKKDTVSSTLILQSAIKSFVAISSIISLLFMISFE